MNRLGLTLAGIASRIWAEARARVALDIGLSGGSSGRDREKLYPILMDFLQEAIQDLTTHLHLQQVLSGRDAEMVTILGRCDNSIQNPVQKAPFLAPPCVNAEATRQVAITYNVVDIDVLFLCRVCARNIGKWARSNDYTVEITPLACYPLELITEGKQEEFRHEV